MEGISELVVNQHYHAGTPYVKIVDLILDVEIKTSSHISGAEAVKATYVN